MDPVPGGEADGVVHLPTILPLDERGERGRAGDPGGQYAYCLERADALLREAGLSLDVAVATYDYSTPATRDDYRKTHAVRKERLGGAGVFPAAGGILMSRLHAPGGSSPRGHRLPAALEVGQPGVVALRHPHVRTRA